MKIENLKKRFVIHKHTRSNKTHWDLMLEWPDCNKLKTWRLDNPPEKLATDKTKAMPIFDHDKKFLTYQGSLSNGKGSVEIADKGSCTIESSDEHNLKINFDGKILKGSFGFEL